MLVVRQTAAERLFHMADPVQQSVGDSDEPLGRMLGALRFWFTKDLVYCSIARRDIGTGI